MDDNLDTGTVIELKGFSLPAIACPMCGTKYYPPQGAKWCMNRHTLLAQEHGLQLCRRCREPKRKNEFSSPQASCCNECKQKVPSPSVKRDGHYTEFKEYLDDRTYSWGGIG